MGLENDAMCGYLARPDVFADCWNGACFNGEMVLDASQLHAMSETYYRVKQDEKKSEKRQRDLIMKASKEAAYAILAIENQSEIDYRMPVRRMEYDAMEYQRQVKDIMAKNRAEEKRRKECGDGSLWRHNGEFLSGFRKDDKLLPVATLVVYHGTQTYDGCLDLHGMLQWNQENERVRPWVPNYTLQVAALREMDETKFQTGLRELIGVMKRSENDEALHRYCEENETRFRELDEETVNTIGAMIHYPELNRYRNEKGEMEMCKALEDLRRKGFEEGVSLGLSQGISEGISQGIKALVDTLKECGMDRAFVCEKVMVRFDLTDAVAEEHVKRCWVD